MSTKPDPLTLRPTCGTVWSPARVNRELEQLRTHSYFHLDNHRINDGLLQLEGRLALTQQETGRVQSLAIRMEYPAEYPWEIPTVFDRAKQFQPSAKGHQFPNYRLCLSFPPRQEFTVGSESLSSEVLGASLIWMDKRFIFERTTKWPGDAEDHGWAAPLRRLLVEEANKSGAISLKVWIDWVIEELVTPNFHGSCPCCSGRLFRLCHNRLAMLVYLYLFCNGEERDLYVQRKALEAA